MKFLLSLSLCMLVAFGWGDNIISAFTTTRTANIKTPSTYSTSLTAASATTTTSSSSSWFASPVSEVKDEEKSTSSSSLSILSVEQIKAQILQLGAALDRGQSYNPTSGSYYEDTMNVARMKIDNLLELSGGNNIPTSLEEIAGEWELVLSTVPHGIFRSSPFFLAIQESYEYAESNEMNGELKSNLFFRLHELQTCSWGVSKIGRVAQRIDVDKQYLYSEFDTSIFSLTVIPILGWFKLLPTFGGCVVTASKCTLDSTTTDDDGVPKGQLNMEVDYTTSRKVPGLSGLPLIGDFIWKVNVPVGAIWKLLPWNKGRPASCKVYVKYVDDDFRIVQDIDGEYFVYTRPVVPRELDI